jgi:SpoVK/Ycf46/Vps4 family AAA+-type ATPase
MFDNSNDDDNLKKQMKIFLGLSNGKSSPDEEELTELIVKQMKSIYSDKDFDALVQAEFMRTLAEDIDEQLQEAYGHKMGFFLTVFEFNTPGQSNYISNCNRKDIVKSLEEIKKRFENREINPTADIRSEKE